MLCPVGQEASFQPDFWFCLFANSHRLNCVYVVTVPPLVVNSMRRIFPCTTTYLLLNLSLSFIQHFVCFFYIQMLQITDVVSA